ncbi:MAG: AAA family ATPase [Gemmatimonadota bacterium]|nr:AAA family ATPase [Gemmatimonadota bacterium]
MNSATGRWVSGDDFFDRKRELQILETRVRDRNHVLLTGQRRMGKTSIVRELGRRLEADGWIFLFADVEGATSAEDVITEIARAAHPVRSIASRFAAAMKRFINENFEEITAIEFGVKIRAGLNEGNWRHHGEQMFNVCANQDRPVLLVIDELPIFLKRMLQQDENAHRVDQFLSWLRGVLQKLGDGAPVLIVSGSIGLEPLVRRIGIPDRINHLYPYRLGPWDLDTSVKCFNRLAESYAFTVKDGVAEAVYNALGIGIPHHVQSFFARLRDFATMHGRDLVKLNDVDHVYRNELLGPSGQSNLVHYETRLKEGLEDESYPIAMEILAEAAVQEVFTSDARHSLGRMYSRLVDDAPSRIADILEVLEHDGYLKLVNGGYRFESRMLKDWWSSRFRDHHIPILRRDTYSDSSERA